MKHANFLKIFNKFNEKYSDLIDEFEVNSGSLLSDYSYDIFTIFESMLKINKNIDIENILLNVLIESTTTQTDLLSCLNEAVSKITLNNQELTSTQRYFRDVNDVYEKHNNDYDVEYCEENRNKLIEMNLKSGKSFVIRQKMPENKMITYYDEVYGNISINSNDLDDQVLIKQDRLSNV